jgi:hypothetical protein
VTTREVSLKLVSSHPSLVGDAIVFAASDAAGSLEVYVTPMFWEMLQAECPVPCDADDRHDFAAQAVEMMAETKEAATTSAGARVVFVG